MISFLKAISYQIRAKTGYNLKKIINSLATRLDLQSTQSLQSFQILIPTACKLQNQCKGHKSDQLRKLVTHSSGGRGGRRGLGHVRQLLPASFVNLSLLWPQPDSASSSQDPLKSSGRWIKSIMIYLHGRLYSHQNLCLWRTFNDIKKEHRKSVLKMHK